MRDYNTPGVYVEELPNLPGSVAGVSTAVPAFIGYTKSAGPKGDLWYKPTRITTLKEYEDLFGPPHQETITVDARLSPMTVSIIPATSITPSKLMYYSMQMFFNNGGEGCYIVALKDNDTSATVLTAIKALELEDEPTLIVVVDGVSLSDYYTSICQKVLEQCNSLKDRFGIFDVIQKAANTTETDAKAFRDDVGTSNLKYGAAYYPYLNTTLKYQYTDDMVTISYKDSDGVEVKDVKLNTIKNTQTAVYNQITAEIAKYTVTLPPSAAVAGAYASVDRDRGVWKAPANVSLVSVNGPAKKLTEEDNGKLNIEPDNGKSINAIRSFTGKGTLIWGARTLAGNDNEWRYIPVRRLFNYIEESVKKATSFAVFEPNNAMTWLKLRSMVESFLDSLWRQGALAGGKAEDAYFVQVGLGTTMTSQDILEGRLIIKIGIAAVRPAEFIILEFTHKLQQS